MDIKHLVLAPAAVPGLGVDPPRIPDTVAVLVAVTKAPDRTTGVGPQTVIETEPDGVAIGLPEDKGKAGAVGAMKHETDAPQIPEVRPRKRRRREPRTPTAAGLKPASGIGQARLVAFAPATLVTAAAPPTAEPDEAGPRPATPGSPTPNGPHPTLLHPIFRGKSGADPYGYTTTVLGMVALAITVALGATHVRRVTFIGALLADQPPLRPAIARVRPPRALGPCSAFPGPGSGAPPHRESRTAAAAFPGAAAAVEQSVGRTAAASPEAEEMAAAGDLTPMVGAISAAERHGRKAAMAKRLQPTFHGEEPAQGSPRPPLTPRVLKTTVGPAVPVAAADLIDGGAGPGLFIIPVTFLPAGGRPSRAEVPGAETAQRPTVRRPLLLGPRHRPTPAHAPAARHQGPASWRHQAAACGGRGPSSTRNMDHLDGAGPQIIVATHRVANGSPVGGLRPCARRVDPPIPRMAPRRDQAGKG